MAIKNRARTIFFFGCRCSSHSFAMIVIAADANERNRRSDQIRIEHSHHPASIHRRRNLLSDAICRKLNAQVKKVCNLVPAREPKLYWLFLLRVSNKRPKVLYFCCLRRKRNPNEKSSEKLNEIDLLPFDQRDSFGFFFLFVFISLRFIKYCGVECSQCVGREYMSEAMHARKFVAECQLPSAVQRHSSTILHRSDDPFPVNRKC